MILIDFYGFSFYTKKGILIPRPETEELVDWIIKDNKGSEKRYLDIGTGSGCIIISISKNLEGIFEAIDLSKDSIQVAGTNILKNKVNVNLKQLDVLNDELEGEWDVIISNPPYILNSQKEFMNKNRYRFVSPKDLSIKVNNTYIPISNSMKIYYLLSKINYLLSKFDYLLSKFTK